MAWLGARQTRAGVTTSEISGFGLVLTTKRMVAAPPSRVLGRPSGCCSVTFCYEEAWEGPSLWFLPQCCRGTQGRQGARGSELN